MFVPPRKHREYLEARRLRAAGWSLRAIARNLEIALSTASAWLRDMPRPPARERVRSPRPPRTTPEATAGSRLCPRCSRTLPLSAFNRRGKGHQGWCRECFRSYFRQRGRLHRDQSTAAKRRRRALGLGFLDSYLQSSRCADCGHSDPDVLEFDHVGFKRGDVGVLAGNGASIRALRAEIAECEVVCVNCHRRRTSRREGSWRANPDDLIGLALLTAHERRNVLYVRNILRASECVDCGDSDPAVLEFDHVGEKAGNVGQMARTGCSFERLRAEVSRCEVRCANCHRRRTRVQLGHRSRSVLA